MKKRISNDDVIIPEDHVIYQAAPSTPKKEKKRRKKRKSIHINKLYFLCQRPLSSPNQVIDLEPLSIEEVNGND